MCGIVGFVNKSPKKEKKEQIELMLKRIAHRGPDSKGVFVDDDIALGFRRLSIIDVKGGSQPIYNEDNSLAIIFNGEIYNFLELKETLLKKGHVFKTKTDTEVILHGYEEYGTKIVEKLRGMFGFVIWNTKTKELFGARDPFGIKPLYFSKMKETFFFGSEIKAFLDHPDFVKALNKGALKPYLTFQYSVLDETFFKGVFKLLPGHYFIYKNNELEVKEYYQVEFNAKDASMKKYEDEIEKVVKSSVQYHKISDVPVGSFLSGGVDSSYITTLLAPDKTFSVGFERKGYSEVSYAKELSEKIKTKNISEIIEPDEFFSELENIQYYSDEPHANLSAVPLYFLARLARKHVTVVLSGEGADELFGGYEAYELSKNDKTYRKLPKFVRYPLGKVASRLPYFKGHDFLIKNGLPVEDYYIGQAKIFDEEESTKILKPEYLNAKTIKEITAPYFAKVKDKDDLTKMQYLDMHLWLPNDILLKADKMTMAHSIELRVPFLDKEVMKVASQIPTKYKLKENTTKYVFRAAANRILPDEWATRPKLGFPVPFSAWAMEEKYYKQIRKIFKMKFASLFFDQDEILKLLDNHYNLVMNNGRKIWTIYCFLLWYKVYFIDER